MATVTANTPTACASCGKEILPHWHHGKWQQYCSHTCANRAAAWAKIETIKVAYDLSTDEAFRQWLIGQLNRCTVEAVAQLCGVHKQALYQWMARLRIRRHVWYD